MRRATRGWNAKSRWRFRRDRQSRHSFYRLSREPVELISARSSMSCRAYRGIGVGGRQAALANVARHPPTPIPRSARDDTSSRLAPRASRLAYVCHRAPRVYPCHAERSEASVWVGGTRQWPMSRSLAPLGMTRPRASRLAPRASRLAPRVCMSRCAARSSMSCRA